MMEFMESEDTRAFLKKKLRQYFDGKIVRKDLTKKIKEGANVPVYVLEFLLGQYCSSDDLEVIEQGIEMVKHILAENFVRPDEAQKVLSVLRRNTAFDNALNELNERTPEWEPNRNPVRSFWYVVEKYDDTKYEEKEVLYRYLGAKYYEHPYYYGWQSVEACHNQYNELASSVLDNYTGYYAEEIQNYRDKILKRYQRLEDFKRYTIIPSCKADVCKYSGAIEVCPDGSITAYNYCWSHKCKSLGCRNDKDTLDYCTEHCPWNDICSYNKCDKLVYYEGELYEFLKRQGRRLF